MTSAEKAAAESDAAVHARMRSQMLELKAQRGGAPQELLDSVRELNSARSAIRKALASGPATVPALAEATGIEARRVLWLVTAMRKYGAIAEDTTEGSYVRYALTNKEAR